MLANLIVFWDVSVKFLCCVLVSVNALAMGTAVEDFVSVTEVGMKQMQYARVVPNHMTMGNVLSTCAGLGTLGIGDRIHEFIRRRRNDVDSSPLPSHLALMMASVLVILLLVPLISRQVADFDKVLMLALTRDSNLYVRYGGLMQMGDEE